MRALALLLWFLAGPAPAETIRVASYHLGLARDGAGVLLRDLERGEKDDVRATAAVIRAVRPDILLIAGFDHDPKGRALAALRALLAEGPDGIAYPHTFNAPGNNGEPSGHDLDGDTLRRGWGDNFGWGKFPGHGGMALLSRLPVEADAARTFRTLLWADLPGAERPRTPDGALWPTAAAAAAMRLASAAHWDIPVRLPDGGRLRLLAANPTPPLFDGPEQRNVLRNRDELRFWSLYLDGTPLPDDQGRTGPLGAGPVILLGDLSVDPADGRGARAAIAALIAHPRLQDPAPTSAGGAASGAAGVNAAHAGPPATDTADWRDTEGGPGNLRVDYVLPDARLTVTGSGVFWPADDTPLAEAAQAASAHRLVWVDIALP